MRGWTRESDARFNLVAFLHPTSWPIEMLVNEHCAYRSRPVDLIPAHPCFMCARETVITCFLNPPTPPPLYKSDDFPLLRVSVGEDNSNRTEMAESEHMKLPSTTDQVIGPSSSVLCTMTGSSRVPGDFSSQ